MIYKCKQCGVEIDFKDSGFDNNQCPYCWDENCDCLQPTPDTSDHLDAIRKRAEKAGMDTSALDICLDTFERLLITAEETNLLYEKKMAEQSRPSEHKGESK